MKHKRKRSGLVIKRLPVGCQWGKIDFEVADNDIVTLFTKARGTRVILASGTFDSVALQLLRLCANFNCLVEPELGSTERHQAVEEFENLTRGL